jgi:hypothetical protein
MKPYYDDAPHWTDQLREGQWILFEYGYDKKLFYVKEPRGEIVILGRPDRSASEEHCELRCALRARAENLGMTKRRWWRRFLPIRLQENICPWVPPIRIF